MRTTYAIYRPGRPLPELGEIEGWPPAPGIATLHALLDPILCTADMEHVSVLHPNGHRVDMFVDERGMIKRLPRNEGATRIYRANWIKRNPGAAPEALSWIAGPAVVFDRVVWG